MKYLKKNTLVKQMLISIVLTSAVTNIYAGLPNPGMAFDPKRTAVVIPAPQNDFLS